MTGVATWNKGTVQAGTDGWNLRNDTQRAMETLNVVVPVGSSTARDALAPPGGTYPGMIVVRTDLAGLPLEKWDGSGWKRTGPKTYTFNRGAGSDSTFTGALTTLVSGTITAAPAGLWRIEGFCGLYGSTSATGRTFVSTGASPTYYKRRQDLDGTPSTYGLATYFAHSGGDLTVAVGYDVVAGTAAVMAAASGETSVIATFLGN